MPYASSMLPKHLIMGAAAAALSLSLLAGVSGRALAAPYVPPLKPLAIDDIARYPAMTGVAISPDGKHIAALIAVKDQPWPVISIWDTSDLSKTPIWIPSKTQRIDAVGFFTSDKIFFQTEQPITGFDGKPTFIRKLYYSDLEGKKIEDPFEITGTMNKDIRDQLQRGASATIFNNSLYDPTKVLMETTDPESLVQKIFELDTTTGKTRTVALGSDAFEFDPAGVDLATGEPRIKEEVVAGQDGEYWFKLFYKDDGGNWVQQVPLSYKVKDRHAVKVLGYDSEPGKLIVAANLDRDHTAIYSYDLKSQAFSPDPLFANDRYDVNDVGFRIDRANKTTSILAVEVAAAEPTAIYQDDGWAAAQGAIKAAFPGKDIALHVSRGTYDSAVVEVSAENFPTQYYLYQNAKLVHLGDERPWIDPASLGRPEFVTFKARDGLDIPAYITYPPGWTPDQGPVPLVVLPHGGPWTRDEGGWDPTAWPQFLATRGIAVIQPQYRGSEGWGDKLWKAGDNEWGQKMSDDNDDAATYMVSRGIADPKRMAIFGYSYGGFAAIAASVRPNSPYRCAISGAGISSLDRVGNLWGASHIQRDLQGHTVSGMDPIKNVDKANIPIMLFHGDHDRTADTDHSRMFYAAMKAAGKDIEYTEIKGMWHTIPWHVEWQQQSLGLIEAYLKSPKCGLIE